MYAAWLADFASRGVGSIGFGVVILQRPATDRDTWQVLEEVSTAVTAHLGQRTAKCVGWSIARLAVEIAPATT